MFSGIVFNGQQLRLGFYDKDGAWNVWEACLFIPNQLIDPTGGKDEWWPGGLTTPVDDANPATVAVTILKTVTAPNNDPTKAHQAIEGFKGIVIPYPPGMP